MDKVSYALGMSVASNLIQSGVKSLNIDDFATAIKDITVSDTSQMTPDEANQILGAYFENIRNEEKLKTKTEGEEYLKLNKTKDGVMTTKSGLQYKVITEGTGKQPGAHDHVDCNYEGCFINGQIFDSSYKRGKSAQFGLDQVIKGWTEGLQLMKEGAKYEFYIPYQLAYGENGMPGAIPPCSALIFTVELLKVL